VDLFRPPPMSPLIVTNQIARSGRRIKVVDVNIASDVKGRGIVDIARGSVVMLKKSENPDGEIWSPTAWEIRSPPEDMPAPGAAHKGPDSTASLPIWQTVNVQDDTGEPYDEYRSQNRKLGVRRAWIRETYSLISGMLPSQLVRIAQVADFANPFTNSGTKGLNYINADITLYLQRTPVGSWIGTETSYHGADRGVSVGTMSLYDRCGRVGTSTVCGLAQARS
ncbi:MAG: thioesterase family protein, partial [SAR202 cluster bacterium]|nr:thioesterase family protein [SAR202 cluster bacterium]